MTTAVREALADCITRLERCAKAHGSDDEHIDTLLAPYRAALAQDAEPVPREPTQAMLDAAPDRCEDVADVWRAMWDAARLALAQEPATELDAASDAATPEVREARSQPHATASTPLDPPADDLVRRLRDAEADYTIAWGNGDLYEEAADALAAHDQRIAALEESEALHGRLLANAYQRAEAAERRAEAAEQLRPLWAQGYTSSSVAAQVTGAALSQIWTALSVDNQTDAMTAINAAIAAQNAP
jgi:hypothetical protein